MGDPFAPGLLGRLPAPPRKVVLVRASRIGDFVCATPAFRALREAMPGAEIALIALPFNRALAARSPRIDRSIEFPGWPGIAEQFFDARRATAFLAEMQRERFDLAIQMHGSGVFANPFTLLLGAARTAGFVRPGDPPGPLDAALPVPEDLHEVRRLVALAEFLGAPDRGEGTEFPLWPEDRAAAEALLAGAGRPLIGVHASAREEGKMWPPGLFIEAAEEVRRSRGGTIVLVGERADGGEPAGSRSGTAGAPPARPVLDLAGRTTVPVLGAVVERLSVLLTNDSGPAHVAYALGTPSVTVFVETDPARWGPLRGDVHRVVSGSARPAGVARAALEVLRG